MEPSSMTYTSRTNHFFNQKIYHNLSFFACLPTNYIVLSPSEIKRDQHQLSVAAFLLPIFIPAAIANFAISLALVAVSALALAVAAVSALVHGLALLAAGTLDALPSSPTKAL
jgi:hypothetical protein